MSLKWAMIIAVIIMFPLTLLWHMGAKALPVGALDEDGDAAKEALTEGDPKGHPQTTGPSALISVRKARPKAGPSASRPRQIWGNGTRHPKQIQRANVPKPWKQFREKIIYPALTLAAVS